MSRGEFSSDESSEESSESTAFKLVKNEVRLMSITPEIEKYIHIY